MSRCRGQGSARDLVAGEEIYATYGADGKVEESVTLTGSRFTPLALLYTCTQCEVHLRLVQMAKRSGQGGLHRPPR